MSNWKKEVVFYRYRGNCGRSGFGGNIEGLGFDMNGIKWVNLGYWFFYEISSIVIFE